MLEHKTSPEELDIFMNGSRTSKEDGSCCVGCAIVPSLDLTHKLKLNKMTSSYMAEVFAIDRALDLCRDGYLPKINICTDSLSFLDSLENSSVLLFPVALSKEIEPGGSRPHI